MDSPGEILSLCRLCLVKDQVNIPIFEEQGDIRQIFLKISSCLPVTITRHDQLPKRICDACSNKLDLLYEFWNSSASAEKTLLSWLGQAGVEDAGEKISAVAQQIAKPAETLVKEESEALDESNLINESRDSFDDQSLDEGTKDEAEAPPPKRARRTAAVKAQINITPESDEDEDDEFDAAEAMTKMEDESEESESELKDDPSYSELPGTSADDDQAGPSGVGKDGVEAPDMLPFIIENDGVEEPDINYAVDLDHDYLKHQALETCPVCKMVCFAKSDMLAHIENKHRKQNDNHQCDICGKVLKRKHLLRNHITLMHLKQYNVFCEMCGKGFLFMDVLNRHKQLMHPNGEIVTKIRYPCLQKGCDKSYTTKRALAYHQRTRHNICPPNEPMSYSCEICGKVILSRENLQTHLRAHSGDKPFKCDICGKAFLVKKYLKEHSVVHTGEKPFVCKLCDKTFSQGGGLYVHTKRCHPDVVQKE